MGDVYNPQNLNRHAYCVNNPIKYMDPTGLIWGYNGERNSYQWFQNDNVPEGWEQVSIGTVYTAWNGRQVRLGFNKYWNYVDEEPKEIDFQHGLGNEFAAWYAGFAAENALFSLGGGIVGSVIEKGIGRLLAREAAVAGNTANKGAEGFFEGAKYTSKVSQQMSKIDDIFHAFPKSVDGFAAKFGKWSTRVGADGKTYQWLEVPGSYRGKTGIFEFIKNSNGEITHRFFNTKP